MAGSHRHPVFSGCSRDSGLLDARWQHQDERNVEVLDAVCDDCVTLSMQDDWRVQHVLEAPENHYTIRDLARQLTADATDAEKAEILLTERATANLIFTQFEHHLKQWQMAVDLGDRSRQRVLREEIEFYAEAAE